MLMLIKLFISILVGSFLVSIGIHFIPIGGTSASTLRTAGVATNAPIVAIVLGMILNLAVLLTIHDSFIYVLLSGSVVCMLSMSVLMFFSNIVDIYGVGVVPTSGNFKKDPITGYIQEDYLSENSNGHGIPTISYISGLIGSFIFGIGGSLIFYMIYISFTTRFYKFVDGVTSIILSVLLVFVIAIISSFNYGNDNQGFYDKSFKNNIKPAILSSVAIAILMAILYIIIVGGMPKWSLKMIYIHKISLH